MTKKLKPKNKNTVEKKELKESSEKKTIIIYLLILLFTFIPTYKYIFDSKIAFLGDNAAYYIYGKAIADGKGMVNTQSVAQHKANSYPPGYPAIIAVIINTVNSDIVTIKVANGIMYFASLVILFFFFRQMSKNIHLSFILTLIMMFNFHLLQYSTWMMSEIPFIFFSALGIMAFGFINTKNNPLKDKWFYIMILGVVVSYHIRSQGIALFGGIFLFFLVQQNWKHLVSFSIAFIALLMPWYIRNSELGASPYDSALKYKNYYDHSQGVMESFGDWMDRFTQNFSRYVQVEIPSGIFGYEPNYENGSWFYGILLLAIIGFGIFKTKKYAFAIGGYVLATFAILMIWPPVWTGVRFMLPIVPILIFFFFYGIFSLIVIILEKVKNKTESSIKILSFAFIIFILVFYPKIDNLNKAAKEPLNPLYRNYFALAEWTKTNLPKDAIIICRKPLLFHLYSDHFVSRVVKNTNPDEALEAMKTGGITHIVQYGDGLSQRYFIPIYKKYPEKFPVLQKTSNPDIYLLKVKY